MKRFFDNKNIATLLLRIGIGLPFILIYGLMKMEGGAMMWEQIGGTMTNFGIKFAPVVWGFVASLTEFGGGILILLGLFTRTAALFLSINMLVAAIQHFSMHDQWYNSVLPLELMSVFLALLLIGAGKYSLDHFFFGRRKLNNS
ncbi:MAG: DoxX family protein [bacterium]